MPRSEWEELIRYGLERSGRTPEPQVYDLIGELAGGHPYLTQLAGSLVWQAEAEGWDEGDVRRRFAQGAHTIFSGLWQRLSKEQVQVVQWVLGLGAEPAVPTSIVTDLCKRGVLTETHEIFCQPFSEFVHEEVRSA
jgi:hypothetical protein